MPAQSVNEVLCLVPARGGSKSIPLKNIYPLHGRPLIAYTLDVAKACRSISRTIVSTDSAEIAQVCRELGAEVPFLRPASIAEDNTPDLPVFAHALEWLAREENQHPEIVLHLRPTSPLRTAAMVEKAIELLRAHPEADSVRAVCPPMQNPFKMWTLGEDGFLHPLLNTPIREAYNQPRQALPPVYWQNGYLDVIRATTITQKKSMTGDKILPLVLDSTEVIDIDSLETLHLAEMRLIGGKQ